MSRYATWEDLVNRYSSAAKASANADMDLAYISPAEAEIDARLRRITTTPFTAPIPDLVKSLTIDVAYYKLTIRTKEARALGEYLYGKDGKSGIFGQILSGDIDVNGTALPNSAWIDKEYHSRFGPDDAINWRPDCDSILDASDERG